MKAINLKTLVVAGMVTAFNAGGTSVMATATDTHSAPPPARYEKGNNELTNDLLSIIAMRRNIRMQKDRIKADCKAGLKADEIRDRNALNKMEADLQKDEGYLLADKKAYVEEYRMSVKVHRMAWNASRSILVDAQKKLRKDRGRVNESNLQKDEAVVTYDKKLVSRNAAALRAEKLLMDNDVVAMNKDIRRAKAESAATIGVQDAYVSVDGWLQK